MIVPKPVEVDHTINESDFQSLKEIFGQWDDEE